MGIFYIRHGLALHNELFLKHGEEAYVYKRCIDSPLVEEGIQQATSLKNIDREKLNNMDLVLVSSLSRTLETAYILFKDLNKNVLVFDELKEYSDGVHTPNKRQSKDILMNIFPTFDYSNLKTENDETWNENGFETIDELDNRIQFMKVYIRNYKKSFFDDFGRDPNISIVSHTSYITRYALKEFQEIKHCHIYDDYTLFVNNSVLEAP